MSADADPIYGAVPDEWRMTTVAELCREGEADVQTGPFGTMLHASSYRQSGTPVVAVKNIGDNCLVHDEIPRVDVSTVQRLSRYILQRGDILFGRKGAVERRAYVNETEAGWLQGSDCIRLRVAGKKADSRYLSLVLGSEAYRNWIVQHAHGATMPSLNQEIVKRIPVPLPPIGEQHGIARVLGTLDDKIALNQKMSATLEGTARTLFKSWFVDFDPVRAKAEGSDSNLHKSIADLFPESFASSESGQIPSGWQFKPIGELASVNGGSTPSTKELSYWDGGTRFWATPKDLSNLKTPVLLDTERKITDAGLSQISSGLLPIGTVLMSSRAPIGYLAVAEVPVAINQGFIAMKPNAGISNLFLLRWAESAHDLIASRANGSTFLEISKSSFRPILVATPSDAVMNEFDRIVRPLHSRVVCNERESRTLARLRDALLPKLISGELRIPDVERIVGGQV
jgi:type I restriction enzyme S subunit